MSAESVTNNEAERQYELVADGAVAVAVYDLVGHTITFTHTVVPEQLEGKGVGTRLVEGALADVRTRGYKVVPQCSFVQHYVQTHPEARDLLA